MRKCKKSVKVEKTGKVGKKPTSDNIEGGVKRLYMYITKMHNYTKKLTYGTCFSVSYH